MTPCKIYLLHPFRAQSWKFTAQVQGLYSEGNKLIYSLTDQFRTWWRLGERITFSCPQKPHCKTVWKRWNQILKLHILKHLKLRLKKKKKLPAGDAFIENINFKTYAQLIICISKRVLFLFIFIKRLSAKFVIRSPCGLLGGRGSCQRCPRRV